MMTAFFKLVSEDRVKVRIMFTQKANVVVGLTREQRENEFFLLYYQFLKHAFGLGHCNPGGSPLRVRILLDQLPDTREKAATFKGYIRGLEKSKEFRSQGIVIPEDAIAEVRSHDHIVMQCLDVVLGAMQFRLNDGHKIKPEGAQRRGARTIAKEKLYKHINRLICEIYPHFNVGVSTGTDGDLTRRWSHSYRHWLFVPGNTQRDHSRTKRSETPPSLSRKGNTPSGT
jgi:hypothetical protein